MCIARNPYRDTNTLLLQVEEENPILTATASHDNIIYTSYIHETPSKHEEECVNTSSSFFNLIGRLVIICLIPMIIVSLLRTSRTQEEEVKALQISMIRIRKLHDRQSRMLEDLDIQTQRMMNTDF